MARVFLAEDRSLGRKVVIKVLAPDLCEGLSHERFRREIQLAAQLQHPHVVPVLQAGEADGIPYFVMPFIPGETLRARLAEGRGLPVREVMPILRDVVRAMAYAHTQGIVHRDIKPDNVLLSGGSAVVSDFGIAKALSSSRTLEAGSAVLTRTGSSLGTPTYMAPEQAAADPNADHRVDLYSFGVMAYELLTGRPPFADRTPQALLTAHLVEPPVPLSSRVPGLPRGLGELVMQCLEKDPADRPASAEELVRRLDVIDWSGEIRSRSAPVSRRRWLVWGAGLAVALAGALVILHRSPGPAQNLRLVAVLPFRVATADPGLRYLREGMLDLLTAKLPGEGGLQAVEPRLTLDAWHEAGGGDTHDLTAGQADQVAGSLGAGWLLQGDVVGTPDRIVLSASLFSSGVGTPRSRVSVDGPPDSLGALVDRLAGALLNSMAEGGASGGNAIRTTLPALRAYLDGVASLRRGLPSSVDFFRTALEQDSTFALAALGIVEATGWWNDPQLNTRGLRLAWQNRQQLSGRDQARLVLLAGPRYPLASPTREVFAAAQRYLQLTPDRADAWYFYGDRIYHDGLALGIPDRASRSAAAFRRALELDSTYVPGYIHLQQLAVELGDSTLDRRLDRLRSAYDTTAVGWQIRQRWYRASARRDTAILRNLWDSLPANDNGVLFEITRTPLSAGGVGADQAARAWDTLIARATTPAGRQGARVGAFAYALLSGRPSQAQAYLEQAFEPDDPARLGQEVMAGTFEHGDSDIAARAAAKLALLAKTAAADSAARAQRATALRLVLTWRLTHGQTAGTQPLLARLHSEFDAGIGPGAPTIDALSVVTLDALYADALHAPNAAAAATRLDSLLDSADYANTSVSRITVLNIVAGRLLERYATPTAALHAVRRRASWWSNQNPFLAIQLREEGRLAARVGERDEAIESLRTYLALRQNSEEVLQPELNEVRQELGKLEVARE